MFATKTWNTYACLAQCRASRTQDCAQALASAHISTEHHVKNPWRKFAFASIRELPNDCAVRSISSDLEAAVAPKDHVSSRVKLHSPSEQTAGVDLDKGLDEAVRAGLACVKAEQYGVRRDRLRRSCTRNSECFGESCARVNVFDRCRENRGQREHVCLYGRRQQTSAAASSRMAVSALRPHSVAMCTYKPQ
jgi:hypothetical protein